MSDLNDFDFTKDIVAPGLEENESSVEESTGTEAQEVAENVQKPQEEALKEAPKTQEEIKGPLRWYVIQAFSGFVARSVSQSVSSSQAMC